MTHPTKRDAVEPRKGGPQGGNRSFPLWRSPGAPARQAPGLETAFVLLLLAVGGTIAYVSWGYGFGSLARPGPGLYPFFVGLAIAVLSLFLLAAHARFGATPFALDRAGAKTLLHMTLLFCAWILAMPLLGYVVVTLLVTWGFCKAMKLEGWRMPLALSGGTALFIHLLFDVWLYIDLPRGILG